MRKTSADAADAADAVDSVDSADAVDSVDSADAVDFVDSAAASAGAASAAAASASASSASSASSAASSASSDSAVAAESPIEAVFRARNARGSAALVPYVTAGYPSRDASVELLLALAEAGADVLEVGIPFSDPLADGPTIQRASFEALEGGMTVRGALDVVRDFRAVRDEPVVLFTYLNPVLHFGTEDFVTAALEAGAQGLLLTDLPAGADPELEAAIAARGLDPVRLLAPTTPPARVPDVARGGRGFLYYISRTGVTGARSELRAELGREVAALRKLVSLPIAVGFGISTPAQAAEVAAVADGVVVGSALTDMVGREGVEAAARLARRMREAMDAGPDGTGPPPGR